MFQLILYLFLLAPVGSQKNEAEGTIDVQEIITLTNIARERPKVFLDSIATPYLLRNGLKTKNTASLVKMLASAKPLKALTTNSELTSIAIAHAATQAKSGKIGHANFSKRYGKLLKQYKMVGENCAIDQSSSLEFLMDFLIDENTPDLGHRKNIFDKTFTQIGVACDANNGTRHICVMSFCS